MYIVIILLAICIILNSVIIYHLLLIKKSHKRNEYDILNEAYNSIKDKIPFKPDFAIVLGSGLATFLDDKVIDAEINYSDIKNFPISTIEGHKGSFVFTTIGNKKVVCMNGRVHMYEGYESVEVVRPIRIIKMMGVEKVLLTNAAGGLNENFNVGDLMIIRDQITSFVKSPLIGKNLDEFGVRFPDMTEVYDKNLIAKIKEVADDNSIKVQEGVYLQTSGPNFETLSEVLMFKKLGADAVAMSTAIEAMAANHMGMKVCGISLITNKAAGLSNEKLSHEEVMIVGRAASEKFKILVENLIKKC